MHYNSCKAIKTRVGVALYTTKHTLYFKGYNIGPNLGGPNVGTPPSAHS